MDFTLACKMYFRCIQLERTMLLELEIVIVKSAKELSDGEETDLKRKAESYGE